MLCVLQITLYIVYMTNENFDLNTFSGRLAYAMEITNNSNQTSFAKSIGVTPQTIQYLVSQGKGSTHASKIAEKLGISADWLVYGQGEIFDKIRNLSPAELLAQQLKQLANDGKLNNEDISLINNTIQHLVKLKESQDAVANGTAPDKKSA